MAGTLAALLHALELAVDMRWSGLSRHHAELYVPFAYDGTCGLCGVATDSADDHAASIPIAYWEARSDWGQVVGSASALCGRSVLVVEDEPLIALDLTCELETFGAEVSSANSVRATLSLLKRQRFAAAVLDFRLSDGCTHEVRSELEKLSIPYLIYTGYDEICTAWPEVMVLSKPVAMHVLIETIADLLPRAPTFAGKRIPPANNSRRSHLAPKAKPPAVFWGRSCTA